VTVPNVVFLSDLERQGRGGIGFILHGEGEQFEKGFLLHGWVGK